MEVPKPVQDACALAGGASLSDAAFKTLADAVFASLLDPAADTSSLLRCVLHSLETPHYIHIHTRISAFI